MDLTPPPDHLSASAKEWWQAIVSRYELQEHHLRLAQLMLEAWDQAQEAREMLAEEGLTVEGREGGTRPHPAAAILRDARLAVARLCRELDLDTSPPTPERYSLPAIHSNRQLSGARSARKASQA
jgi:P27 family predicted phage terminase small subunit